MSYYETTYGEVIDYDNLYNEIKKLLETRGLKCNIYKFYDFGSGYGRLVNNFTKYFEKSIGVELVKDRHDVAIKENIVDNLILINSNFFDIKLDGPLVLFVNNLCFGKGTNKRLSKKICDELNNNDIVIVTKKLDLLEKYFINFVKLDCSWGKSEFFFYIFLK